MSGGFFRGTSADQDTRFSNKQAKLMKSQKFAPELDHLVDMTKVKLDVIRPWIANRVTEILGFEDEVVINFIYGLLEGKGVNGKEVQISLTGFMEKNTGKFMKELWSLLLSALKNASGVPQQLLDAKGEEIRKKQAEQDRIAGEVQKKRDNESREIEQERSRIMDGEVETKANHTLEPTSAPSEVEKEVGERNDVKGRSRGSLSRSISRSRSNSKNGRRSMSRSPEGQKRSSPRRRSMTPRRRRLSPGRKSSYYRRRSRSRSITRSPSPLRRRSPSPVRRRRSPSPFRRRRSPSPFRRRRSPSPLRRRSPSPVRRRRSPSPLRRRRSPSPLRRRRSPSPLRRRRSPSPLRRRRSPLPLRRRRSPSSLRRHRSPTPVLRRSPLPMRRRSPSPIVRGPALSRQRSLTPRSSASRSRSASPVGHRSPSPRHLKSPSLIRQSSPAPIHGRSSSPLRRRSPSPKQHRSPSLIQRRRQRSPSPDRRRSPILGRRRSPTSSPRRSPVYSSSQSPPRRRSSLDRKIGFKDHRPPVQSPGDRIKPPQRYPQSREDLHSKESDMSPSPWKSPIMEVITRKRSPNENKRSFSPKRENELDDVNLSPKRKGREQTARHVIPEMRKDKEDNKHTWEDEDHKSRSSHRRSQLSSAVNKQKESSVKVNEEDYSPDAAGRRAFESRIRLDKMESRSKDQEIKNEKLLGKEKQRAPHKRDGEKSYERDNSPPISVKEREGKVEYNSQSATDSEESGKHRHEVREKKKHRRSERREAASDDDSNYESEIEGGRKDAKRRRKEEKKSRKEEKRRRREDRRRKREEKHSEKLKTKGHNDVSVLDKDSNQSNDEETESERKRLEIELRQKALESLKAKKGISN